MSLIWEYIVWGVILLMVLLVITIWIEFFAKSLFDIASFGISISIILWGIILWMNIFENTFYTCISSIGFIVCFSALKVLLRVRNIPCHRIYQFV